jgi:hypothetical protein
MFKVLLITGAPYNVQNLSVLNIHNTVNVIDNHTDKLMNTLFCWIYLLFSYYIIKNQTDGNHHIILINFIMIVSVSPFYQITIYNRELCRSHP